MACTRRFPHAPLLAMSSRCGCKVLQRLLPAHTTHVARSHGTSHARRHAAVRGRWRAHKGRESGRGSRRVRPGPRQSCPCVAQGTKALSLRAEGGRAKTPRPARSQGAAACRRVALAPTREVADVAKSYSTKLKVTAWRVYYLRVGSYAWRLVLRVQLYSCTGRRLFHFREHNPDMRRVSSVLLLWQLCWHADGLRIPSCARLASAWGVPASSARTSCLMAEPPISEASTLAEVCQIALVMSPERKNTCDHPQRL